MSASCRRRRPALRRRDKWVDKFNGEERAATKRPDERLQAGKWAEERAPAAPWAEERYAGSKWGAAPSAAALPPPPTHWRPDGRCRPLDAAPFKALLNVSA